MPTVVGIRFKKAGKIYYFDPALSSVAQGDHAIVETARGVEYGEVVVGPREVSDSEVVSPLKPVLRKATDEDAQKVEENIVREKEAFNICLRKITNHDLPMRLIDVEFTFDVNKIIFYFTAEGRIDFRELVKDLAAVFRTRIELRQIGVRDEAKMLGGIGSCGRPLCCLKYENHMYCCKEGGCKRNCGNDRVEIPKLGSLVVTPLGEGKVTGINRAMRTASVQLTPDNVIQVEWDEIVDASKADPI